ncbi:MAG: hypothetical protein AAGA56_21485, partial [Myxococcota bacterium]
MKRGEGIGTVFAAIAPLVSAGCGSDIGSFPIEACAFAPGRALDVSPNDADYFALRDVEVDRDGNVVST